MENQIQGGFTAPDSFSQKTKRTDIQLLPMGANLGVLTMIVDLGTHMESFNGAPKEPKRKIKVIFEHPQLKQFFYEDDTEKRSTISMFDSTFNMGDNSKLKEIVNAAHGRVLTYDEAVKFDISKLIGQRFAVQIKHQQGKRDTTKTYEKIVGVYSPQGVVVPIPFEPENELNFFYIDKDKNQNLIGNNFMSSNYAKLPLWIKKTILESQEAIAYAAKGGQFAEYSEDATNASPSKNNVQNVQQNNQVSNGVPAAPSTNKKLVIHNGTTLDQWTTSGWTIEMMISQGHAHYEEVALPPPPAPVQNIPNPVNPAFSPNNQNLGQQLGTNAPVQNNFQQQTAFNSDDEHDDLPF